MSGADPVEADAEPLCRGSAVPEVRACTATAHSIIRSVILRRGPGPTGTLSLRDVELLGADRGAVVSYETVRRWCKRFAASFSDRRRRRRPRPLYKWHKDDVFIRSEACSTIWRAVDQNGGRARYPRSAPRDANAAKRFFRRLLKGLQCVPRVIVTDKLRSYGIARRQLSPRVEHRQSRYLNNRTQDSHRPTRRRERQIRRSKSSPGAQPTAGGRHSAVGKRHLDTKIRHRQARAQRHISGPVAHAWVPRPTDGTSTPLSASEHIADSMLCEAHEIANRASHRLRKLYDRAGAP